MSTWKNWWRLFYATVIMALLVIGLKIAQHQEKEAQFRAWADAQWAVQPTFVVPVCDPLAGDCKDPSRWWDQKFYWFPDSRICDIQSEYGDCSGNYYIRPAQLSEMEAYFASTGWVQPERFPPWWQISCPGWVSCDWEKGRDRVKKP